MKNPTLSPVISVVTPFYNEESVVHLFFARLLPILDSLDRPYEIVCVNDGSKDQTLVLLLAMAREHSQIKVVDLSRNFGKEAALTAALDHATGDAVIPVDCDLQDPPELIPRMVELWLEGAEVVLARRADRNTDTWMKRTTAGLFYRIHNRISDFSIPDNVGDFRLMDRAVVNVVRSLPETRRFMKGVFAWAGFQSVTLDYERESRVAGETKFNGWKLWNLALEGISSFSTAPLRIWMYIGMLVATFALLYSGLIVVKTFYFGVDVPGYASLLSSILFLGGVQLIGIGVLGEYIGRVYMETKRRPIYVVRKMYHYDDVPAAHQ